MTWRLPSSRVFHPEFGWYIQHIRREFNHFFSDSNFAYISKDQWLRLQTVDDGISPHYLTSNKVYVRRKGKNWGCPEQCRTSWLSVREWGKLVLRGGIVLHRGQINNQDMMQLILAVKMKEEVIAGIHDFTGLAWAGTSKSTFSDVKDVHVKRLYPQHNPSLHWSI